MLYRLKIVKCLDVILNTHNLEEVIDIIRRVVSKCSENSKLYIHVLDIEDDVLVDKKLVITGSIKEVLHRNIQQHDQP